MPRPIHTLFVSLNLLIAAVSAGDGGPGMRVLELDLPKAIRFALAKNFTLEAQRLEPKIASERVRSAWGRFDPTLDVSFRRGEDTVRDGVRRDENGNDIRFAASSVGQTTRWSTGVSGVTIWGLGYDAAYSSRTFSGTANRFDEDVTSEMSFSITQPLLRGAGKDANLANVRIAKNNLISSEWALRERAMLVITDVIEVYNDLNFTIENLEVAKRSRELARRLLQDNIKRVEAGVMTPLDVTTAQAEVAAREEKVIQAGRAMKDQENFLKQLVTDDLLPLLGTRVEIRVPPTPDFAGTVIAGVREALELRPDYQQARLDLKNSNIALAYEKNQLLPRLDLTASLRLLGVDDDMATSTRRIAARDQSAWSAGATFSMPLGNLEAVGRVNAAKLQAAQALVQLKQIEQAIIVEIDNAYGAVMTARQRIAATRESRRLALESMEAGEKRLIAGTGTVFELLELQEKAATAETAELRAKLDYHKAIARYHQRSGTTLHVHGVKIE